MRNALIAICVLVAMSFVSCQNPVNTVETVGRSVVNSEWKIVKTVHVAKSAREASVLTLADEVAIHNSTTMDDFWWIYPEGEVPTRRQ